MPATVAQIAVDQAAFHFDRLYSYRLTEEAGGVRRGCRVLVPFGGGNRTRQGIVVSLETVRTRVRLSLSARCWTGNPF